MDSRHSQGEQAGGHTVGGHSLGLSLGTRKWPVGVVLLVALAMALAVPLAGRAFGADKPAFPGCGIAPWTGTCTCMVDRDSVAMSYEDFSSALRRRDNAPPGVDVDALLANARKTCRIDRSAMHSAMNSDARVLPGWSE